MKLLRISCISINRAMRRVVAAVGCCGILWKDSLKWDDDCEWKETDGPEWDNDHLWLNESYWSN